MDKANTLGAPEVAETLFSPRDRPQRPQPGPARDPRGPRDLSLAQREIRENPEVLEAPAWARERLPKPERRLHGPERDPRGPRDPSMAHRKTQWSQKPQTSPERDPSLTQRLQRPQCPQRP